MSPITTLEGADPDRGTVPEVYSPDRFTGKNAIVTGAGSGIGRATARRLAAEGANVACVDVVAENAARTAAEINEDTKAQTSGAGGQAVAVTCDIRSEQAVMAAVARSVDEFGSLEVLCNIAGIGRFVASETMALDSWEAIIGVNLTGTFLMCRYALPHLLDGGGVIINTISNTGIQGQPFAAAYCASKGGALLLTKALALEFIERGVRVNAVAPGGVDTPIVWDFMPPEGMSRRATERIMSPLGFAKPSEVASAMAFLASDESAYTTGAILSVDGGLTA